MIAMIVAVAALLLLSQYEEERPSSQNHRSMYGSGLFPSPPLLDRNLGTVYCVLLGGGWSDGERWCVREDTIQRRIVDQHINKRAVHLQFSCMQYIPFRVMGEEHAAWQNRITVP